MVVSYTLPSVPTVARPITSKSVPPLPALRCGMKKCPKGRRKELQMVCSSAPAGAARTFASGVAENGNGLPDFDFTHTRGTIVADFSRHRELQRKERNHRSRSALDTSFSSNSTPVLASTPELVILGLLAFDGIEFNALRSVTGHVALNNVVNHVFAIEADQIHRRNSGHADQLRPGSYSMLRPRQPACESKRLVSDHSRTPTLRVCRRLESLPG